MFIAKNLFRCAALLIALVMVLSLFTACGKQGKPSPTEEPTAVPTEEPTPEPTAEPKAAIIGRWETNYNVADVLNARIEEETGGAYGELNMPDTYIKLYFTFNEDGTYAMEPDSESYEDAMSKVVEKLIPFLKEMVMGIFSAFSEDGQEVTEETILAMLGVDSWDALCDQILEQMDSADDELSMNGRYEVNGNKLSLSSSDNANSALGAQTIVFSIEDDTLTFESVESAVVEGFTDAMMPIVFRRAE